MYINRYWSSLLAGSLLVVSVAFGLPEKKVPRYKDASLPVAERVEDLLSRMTLQEKVGQLTCMLGWEMYTKQAGGVEVSGAFKEALAEKQVGMLWATLRADPWTQKTVKTGLNPELAAQATNALQKYVLEHSRLGIPLFIAEECPHGHMAIGTTVFPTSIGQASTWNPALIGRMAIAIAGEARRQGAHIGYGPVLDLAREPRWSRVEESYGEDPFLIAEMGRAVVEGFQGASLGSGENVIATLKHFVAYGNPEGGHNGGAVSVGMRELFTHYLYPFEKAVRAGALSVMTAYNSIDGIPCTAHDYLLGDLLCDTWGFTGYTVSDLGSIEGLAGSHRVAGSREEAAMLALNAGVDVDLGGNAYWRSLSEAVQAGQVDHKQIDRAVARVLRLKFEMGLFENPYVDPVAARDMVRSAPNRALAGQVAKESVILLKNEGKLLPLSPDLKKIAVIGPNADNPYNQLGDYTAPQLREEIVTVLDGIRRRVSPSTEVIYARGCDIRDTTRVDIAGAVQACRGADVAVVVLGGSSARDFKTEYLDTGAATVSQENGEAFVSDMESGEGFDRATLDLLGKQLELLQVVRATGTPVVLVHIQGRPLNMNWADAHIPAILCAWYPGEQGGTALAEVLFGDYNPAGRLPLSVPRSVGQLPVYYNHARPYRHPYVEETSAPLYPFGYGLSYTQFAYEQLTVELREGKIRCHFRLTNTGEADGEEVVQLYLTAERSPVVTPVKQLKGFRRLFLKKGESTEVELWLDMEELAIYDKQMQRVVVPGGYEIRVGRSSADTPLGGRVVIP